MEKLNVASPTVEEVKKQLQLWEKAEKYEKYRKQEKSVQILFQEKFPDNTKIEEVLIKVAVLNDFYSTNIFDTYSVARHIVGLNIDGSLANADVNIVEKIAQTPNKRFYSFASKYCSHHLPDEFPIYDNLVSKMLIRFKLQDKFSTFKSKDLKDYSAFKTTMNDFKQHYKLEEFSLKEIDRYLWVLAREIFSTKNRN